MSLAGLYRRGILGLSGWGPVSRLVKGVGWRLGVGRFVAGETLQDALPKLRELRRHGLHSNLDLLGEFVDNEAGAVLIRQEISAALDVLSAEPVDRYMSVKPSQLGLGVSFELAQESMCMLAEIARDTAAHLCMDMENHPFRERTLELYRRLHAAGFAEHVSTVLQSYLRDSEADLESLLALAPRPTLRIVKGAYRESPEVAFPDKDKVDAAYRRMVYACLDAGAKVNIATHDEAIIREAESYIRDEGIAPDRYEFQMLYGVKPALQRRLAQRGHTVRIYVPYGQDWYGYFSRRLAERPANLMFVLRGLFG